MVAIPPTTTAGTAPISAAATPDSNAPSSFEALMNTLSTALTRPRTEFGVTGGRMVARSTTLTMSTAPPTPSASMESHISLDNPKTTMLAPKAATDVNKIGPAWRRMGGGRAIERREVRLRPEPSSGSRDGTAPPRGHPWRRSGVARPRQPNSTANRSSERNSTEQYVRPADEPNASERLPDAGPTLCRGHASRAQREDAPERDHRQSEGNHIDELCTERKEETSDRWAGDMRELESNGPLRESAHKQVLRHQRRGERPACRGADGAPDTEHEERPNMIGARST
jgi:hypothetical protein